MRSSPIRQMHPIEEVSDIPGLIAYIPKRRRVTRPLPSSHYETTHQSGNIRRGKWEVPLLKRDSTSGSAIIEFAYLRVETGILSKWLSIDTRKDSDQWRRGYSISPTDCAPQNQLTYPPWAHLRVGVGGPNLEVWWRSFHLLDLTRPCISRLTVYQLRTCIEGRLADLPCLFAVVY